jgi:hypothetical protein
MSAGGEPELYLYWRVGEADVAAAVAAARAWQQGLATRHPGLSCRLLQRTQAGAPTLMEVYRRPGGIGPALAEEIRAGGDALLAPWLDGVRHLEVFAAA